MKVFETHILGAAMILVRAQVVPERLGTISSFVLLEVMVLSNAIAVG